jgi:hypothetical protein
LCVSGTYDRYLSNYNLKNEIAPGEKYFENAPEFKSSPQNNGISAALLKQRLCGSGM